MQAQTSCPSQKYSSSYISDCPNLSLRLERTYLAKYSLRSFRERHSDRTGAGACTRAFPHSTRMDSNSRTSCNGRAECAISCYSESKARDNEVSRYFGVYKLHISNVRRTCACTSHSSSVDHIAERAGMNRSLEGRSPSGVHVVDSHKPRRTCHVRQISDGKAIVKPKARRLTATECYLLWVWCDPVGERSGSNVVAESNHANDFSPAMLAEPSHDL